MGYIDETTKEERTIEKLIRFMKSVENPSWMVELVEDMRDKLAEYEDLEEQGKLPKLPCAVGEMAYYADKSYGKVRDAIVDRIEIDTEGSLIITSLKTHKAEDFGRTCFTTKEEAEAALKEL